jgi:hypothetical protein
MTTAEIVAHIIVLAAGNVIGMTVGAAIGRKIASRTATTVVNVSGDANRKSVEEALGNALAEVAKREVTIASLRRAA